MCQFFFQGLIACIFLSTEESYQFDPGIFEHADPYFHSEQGVDGMFHFSTHYEDESYLVLPAEIIKDFTMIGKTKESFSLPQRNINENQVYDRGKIF